MIASPLNRGRPTGSKNKITDVACGVSVPGAATSAAKMNVRPGRPAHAELGWFYVEGEGWVRWMEIMAQVDEAFSIWRQRCALRGRFIFDAHEQRAADIGAALGRR
jgi:hypothetical protein